MDHLIAGERDPKVLAQLARAPGPPQDRRAGGGAGGRGVLHRRARRPAGAMLARIDRVNAEIDELTEVIERLLAPYEEQLQQAESMPGWGRRAAQDAVAETGVDMTRFPTGGAPGLLGRAHPAGPPVRQARRDEPRPRKATGTWPPSSARPPSRPARPRPAKAPATGGWPAAAARPKPGRRRQHPAEGLPQAAVQPRHALPGPRRRTTTSASATSAARSPTTSASSAPSASKSPSAASPNPTRTEQAGQPGRLTPPPQQTLAGR